MNTQSTVKTTRRSGGSFARSITMDLLLSAEDTQVLYNRWEKAWGEPVSFQGGAVAITAEMVSSAPIEELVAVYGKQRAARLSEIASKNTF